MVPILGHPVCATSRFFPRLIYTHVRHRRTVITGPLGFTELVALSRARLWRVDGVMRHVCDELTGSLVINGKS